MNLFLCRAYDSTEYIVNTLYYLLLLSSLLFFRDLNFIFYDGPPAYDQKRTSIISTYPINLCVKFSLEPFPHL